MKKKKSAGEKKEKFTFIVSGVAEIGWTHKRLETIRIIRRAYSVKQAFVLFKKALKKKYGNERIYLGNCLIRRMKEKRGEAAKKPEAVQVQLDLFE